MASLFLQIQDRKLSNEAMIDAAWPYIGEACASDEITDSGLTSEDIRERLRKVYECSSILELRVSESTDESGAVAQDVRLHNASFCQCPSVCHVCAPRAASMRVRNLGPSITDASRRFPYIYLITFTMRDQPRLRPMIAQLRASWRRFTRMGKPRVSRWSRADGSSSMRKYHDTGEWRKVRGALAGIEVKRGAGSQLWHAHGHCLVFCSEPLDYRVYNPGKIATLRAIYGAGKIPDDSMRAAVDRWEIDSEGKAVPVSKIVAEWMQATDGQGVSLDIEPIRARDGRTVADSARECLKYPVLLERHNSADLPYIIAEIYGKRFFERYGFFRGIPHDDFEDISPQLGAEIYSMTWDSVSKSFGRARRECGPVIFAEADEVRRKVLSQQGRMIGAYRRARRQVADLARAGFVYAETSDAIREIQKLKIDFRAAVGALWRAYDSIPSVIRSRAQRAAASAVALLVPVPVDPRVEQLSLALAPP